MASKTIWPAMMAFIFLVLTTHFACVTSQVWAYYCSGGNYASGSLYAANLNKLLPTLSSDIGNSGFYNASAGLVSAVALCRADIQLSECRDCVRTAAATILQKCPSQFVAVMWEEICTVRYSNQPIYGVLATRPTSRAAVGQVVRPSFADAFSREVEQLIDGLGSRAAQGGALRKAAAGTRSLSSIGTVYAMAQCTPDLSPGDCTSCLADVSAEFTYCCQNSSANIFFRPSCTFRYGTQLFYNLTRLVEPLEPSISPSSAQNQSPDPTQNQSPDPTQNQSPSSTQNQSPTSTQNQSPNSTQAQSPNSTPKQRNGGDNRTRSIVIAVVSVVAILMVAFCVGMFMTKKMKQKREGEDESKIKGESASKRMKQKRKGENDQSKGKGKSESKRKGDSESKRKGESEGIRDDESIRYDFEEIRAATSDFSVDNMLGRGGFGIVYKGKLQDGPEIAVKRLSNNSGQGDVEFRNEVRSIARLQHRNLVKLLGFSLKGNEKLLVYELVKNGSLDDNIFGSTKSPILDWNTRYKIIEGIAMGLNYLHKDSGQKIIHRDLKASNVLLEDNMNPKISDFGLAKLLLENATHDETSRIIGTEGYMAPEYKSGGKFSVKSDVYSFGVLMLEVVVGQKKRCFQNDEKISGDLLSCAWRSWKEDRSANMIDPSLKGNSNAKEDMKTCFHIALLCVQNNPEDRPNMDSVVDMLRYRQTLQLPSEPGFYNPSSFSKASESQGEAGSSKSPQDQV